MADRDLVPIAAEGLKRAAALRQRVRIRAVVKSVTNGRSGAYKNTVLLLEVEAGTHVRVTCAPSGRLAQVDCGTQLDVACGLTGMLDLVENIFFAERVRQIS